MKNKKEDFDTQICCESYDAIIYQEEEVTKLVSSGVYLSLPLDIADYVLRYPEIMDKEYVEHIVDEINKIPN